MAAFLDGKMRFLEIASLVEETLTAYAPAATINLADLFSIDAGARRYAQNELEKLTRGR